MRRAYNILKQLKKRLNKNQRFNQNVSAYDAEYNIITKQLEDVLGIDNSKPNHVSRYINQNHYGAAGSVPQTTIAGGLDHTGGGLDSNVSKLVKGLAPVSEKHNQSEIVGGDENIQVYHQSNFTGS